MNVLIASVMVAVGLTSAAAGQWTVTNLNPVGSADSDGDAARGNKQVGSILVGTHSHASLWSTTAVSRIDLHPAGAADSFGRGVGGPAGNRQVGYVLIGDVRHASLWNGTAASWVDLSPAGTTNSIVFGVNPPGEQQVGVAQVGGVDGLFHASLWSGTAASWVDLHPADEGATESSAFAAGGGHQAGYVMINGVFRASVWTSTAESRVDLHPAVPGGSGGSIAFAAGDGIQGGAAYVGPFQHASLWKGTADSWVDLHPDGTLQSKVLALDTEANVQAGVVVIGAIGHASVWSGAKGSWVDLHETLPPEFSSSSAQGVSSVGGTLFVVGFGHNTLTDRDEALLWTRPICNSKADVAGLGAAPGPDGQLTVDDLVFYLAQFFAGDTGAADLVGLGGGGGPDGQITVDDLVAFLAAFFAGCL